MRVTSLCETDKARSSLLHQLCAGECTPRRSSRCRPAALRFGQNHSRWGGLSQQNHGKCVPKSRRSSRRDQQGAATFPAFGWMWSPWFCSKHTSAVMGPMWKRWKPGARYCLLAELGFPVTDRCTIAELDVGGPDELATTTITSSPTPVCAPCGTASDTLTFRPSLA